MLLFWLHAASIASGHFVLGTFIPGVAQRTGATTYYLELVTRCRRASSHRGTASRPGAQCGARRGRSGGGKRAARSHAGDRRGLRHARPHDADRLVGARVHRGREGGHGRRPALDEARLLEVAHRFSRRTAIADFAAVAAREKSPLNAVLLGAIAASGVLPIQADAFRTAIRAEGKAVDANLRGFEAGLKGGLPTPRFSRRRGPSLQTCRRPKGSTLSPSCRRHASPHEEWGEGMPAEAHAVLAEGIKRLTDYQDRAYALRYLARVNRFAGSTGADGAFIRELARHLAVRMSVEDVIRVAQLKLREARLARVAQEAKARPGDIVDVTEYLKPGPEEIFGLLPPRLGRWALARVRHDRAWPLKVTTTRLSGFLRLKALAGLKRWRPRTLRFAEEEAWVERWLGLVGRTLAVNPAAAREVVATAALVRGYGDTYKRGLASWTTIMEGVVEPMLSGALPRAHFADAVLQARLAASKDPEGTALEATIGAIQRSLAAAQTAAE